MLNACGIHVGFTRKACLTHAWIHKFETNLAHSHDSYTRHKADLDTLRQTIDGELPEYADGPDIDTIIADIVRFGQTTPTAALAPAAIDRRSWGDFVILFKKR